MNNPNDTAVTRAPIAAWQWEFPLTAFAVCLATLGAFGWLVKAGLVGCGGLGAECSLRPGWQLFFVAAIAAACAQIVAIGAARYAHRLRKRALAVTLYVVAAFFSAFSVHEGVAIVIADHDRARIEQRDHDRAQLFEEIAGAQAFVDGQAAVLPTPTSVGPRTQAAALERFSVVTESARERLQRARSELSALPPIEHQPPPVWLLLLFLGWGLIEPWAFTLRDGKSRSLVDDRASARGGAPIIVSTAMGIGAMVTSSAAGASAPMIAETIEVVSPRMTVNSTGTGGGEPQPPKRHRRRFPTHVVDDAVERMRTGSPPDDVARSVGCDRSTAYRWLKRAARTAGGSKAR